MAAEAGGSDPGASMTSAGQVVVVGGSRGLGKLISERFGSLGHPVTVISRNAMAADQVNHVAADLEQLQDAGELAQEVLRYGKIRYLIFSQRYRGAGDPWAGELQVTLNATRLIIEGLQDHFVTDGDRAVGVVSSVYAEFVGGSQPAGYHVAKAGLNQLVKYNAWVLGRKGIRVNSIMPLTYLKPESRDFYLQNSALMDLYKNFVPIGRIGEAADCVDLVEFLCSAKAAFINGQSIFVDGGVSVVWPEELARSMAAL